MARCRQCAAFRTLRTLRCGASAAMIQLPGEGKCLLSAQCLATIAVSAVFGVFLGLEAAYASLLGGGVFVSSTLVFACILFVRQGQSAKGMLFSIYLGEAGKLLWTVGAFFLLFRFLDLSVAACVLGYIFIVVMNILILPFAAVRD